MSKNKENKVSIGTVEAIIKAKYPKIQEGIKWNDVDIVVKRTLTLVEMMSSVNRIVEACFGTDDEYLPEGKDFAVRCVLMDTYANFRLPENVQKCYDFVYECDAAWSVAQWIDQQQFQMMVDAADKKIAHRLEMGMYDVKKQAERFVDEIQKLSDNIGSIFGSVSADDVNALVGAMTNGKIDEEKLAKSIIEMNAKK